MELSFKADGMWFEASVRVDDDIDMYFERLVCQGSDARFLFNSETLNPLIYESAWTAYERKCEEENADLRYLARYERNYERHYA